MKVLVTGGTGNLGSHIVAELTKQNNLQVRIMTLTAPHERAALGTEWAQADLGNEGDVARAVQGIDLIIHAASDYIVDPAHSDVRATGLLLRQANAAGVKHFCYVSIVGSDRVPLPYYGAKVQCEASVRDSGLSWSIFRATQFHSLVDAVIREYAKPLLVAVLPVELRFQSIDVGEVAAELVQSALRCQSGAITEMGGPEVLTLGAMANAWFAIHGKKAAVLPIHIPEQYDPNTGCGLVADVETWRLADAYRRGYNTCSGPHLTGHITWGEWLKRQQKL